ncbi:hypothetical protein LAZ67_2003292 [Cordylochernes scorpioides]|uniref:Uncharacterized protein n=1 Tax=Cordylochernes scorpioides TaxID=51811 RepID=A0ABY6K2P2_9ARAC|nr:hypothetical protein LAZ67_2003292 [Cordylochernes scorpioides]
MKTKIEETKINLPKFSLPSFKGDLDQWLNFKTTFEVTIINISSLNNIQKFIYINIYKVLYLEMHTASIIKGFSLTPDTFDKAWLAFNERYHCTRDLAYKYCNNIKVTNSRSIIQLIDTENTFSTLQDEFTFLEKHRKGLDSINGKIYQKEDNVRKTFKTYQVNTNIIKCTYCNSSHKLGTCQEFAKLSRDDRIKYVRSRNLCINCLGVNHYANNCKITDTCRVCNKKNIILPFIIDIIKDGKVLFQLPNTKLIQV